MPTEAFVWTLGTWVIRVTQGISFRVPVRQLKRGGGGTRYRLT